MGGFFPHLKSNPNPTAEAIREDFVAFHEKHPGITESHYGRLYTREGKTSYEVLLEAIDEPLDEKIIVDLACGNGPLIETLLKQTRDFQKIIGIDLSQKDLTLAKRRCGEHHVQYLCEPAQKLSVPSKSVDTVCCHLAFMLFNPLSPVVEEVHRILKPGGQFIAVISGIAGLPPLFENTVKILKSLVQEKYPHMKDFGWGDRRTWTRKGLHSLFAERQWLASKMELFDFHLVSETTPEQLANTLPFYFYLTYFLNPTDQKVLIQKWKELFLSSASSKGTVAFPFPLTRVVIRKRLPRGDFEK